MDKTLRYLLLLALLSCSAYGQILAPIFHSKPSAGATWTFVGVSCGNNTGCPAAGSQCAPSTTCTATLAANLNVGDTAEIFVVDDGSGSISSVAMTGETVTGPVNTGGSSTTGCAVSNATVGARLGCYYILNATGGHAAVTVTHSGTPSFFTVRVVVAHKNTGSPSLDTANSTNVTSNCTSCSGSALTPSGSSDFIGRINAAQNDNASAVNGGYTFLDGLITDETNFQSYIVNTASGTGPTYTIGVTGQFVEAALAIK